MYAMSMQNEEKKNLLFTWIINYKYSVFVKVRKRGLRATTILHGRFSLHSLNNGNHDHLLIYS